MGIPSTVLPDSSATITDAYAFALEIVNQAINDASSTMYTAAVYNLGGSGVLNYGQDLPSAPIYKENLPFFAFVRKQWNLNDFLAGVVQASGDEGTNQSLVVPKAFENFTLADLQDLKDPYGRRYLAIAQRFGPTVFGMT